MAELGGEPRLWAFFMLVLLPIFVLEVSGGGGGEDELSLCKTMTSMLNRLAVMETPKN